MCESSAVNVDQKEQIDDDDRTCRASASLTGSDDARNMPRFGSTTPSTIGYRVLSGTGRGDVEAVWSRVQAGKEV